jgi:arylsulfatase A-like enzyme
MADTASSIRPFGNDTIVLDGLSQFRSVPSAPELNFATNQDFTVLVRVKPDLVQPRPAFDDVEIVVKWGWQDGYPYALRYMARGARAGTVGIGRFDGKNNPSVWPPAKINDDKFHHLAFVRRTTTTGGVIELYIDGTLGGFAVDTTLASTQNTAPLYVGCRGKPDGNKTSFFAGQIRDLELTPRALSAAEVAARASAGDGTRKQPNILIIVADDLGVDAMQINDATGQVAVHLEDDSGPRPQRLPTFERMLKNGFHFGHTWAQPVCAPSRASLFTGLSPWRTTIGYAAGNNTLPQKQAGTGAPIKSLAEILGAANYRCGIFGKWHLGEPAKDQKRTPADWGWSRFEGITGGGLGPVTAQYAFPASQFTLQLGDLSKTDIDPEVSGGVPPEEILRLRKETQALCREYLIATCPDFVETQPDIRYYVWKKDLEDKDAGIRKYQCPPSERTHLYATRDQVYGAKDWMKQNFGRPWCVTLTLTLPHDPFHVPPRESYSIKFRNPGKPTRQELFSSMVQAMDYYLGQLFDSPEVEVRDALKNTVIFFIGDNGTQDDDPDDRAADAYTDGHLPGGFQFSAQDKGALVDDDLMDKGTHFIGGVHVPLMIVDGGALLGGAPCCLSAQGGVNGKTTNLVHISDIFRTCIEIAGGEVPIDTESVSLLPYLQGQLTPRRNFVFSQQFAPGKKIFGDISKFASISDGTFKLSCVRLQFVDGSGQDNYEYEFFRLTPNPDPDKVGTLQETRLVNFQCNPTYLATAQRLHAEMTRSYALDGGSPTAPVLSFPPLPVDPPCVDVYLLGSTAAGMDAWIDQLRKDWQAMLGKLKTETGVDLAAAVSSYRDVVDGDSLFAIQRKPTTSLPDVQAALDGWTPAATNDVPEGQLFALYELGEMLGTDGCGWRRGTQRIVCWLGDRPGHDPLHVPVLGPTGAKIGVFEVEEAMVLARLQAAGVTVLPIKLGVTSNLDASGQASRVAARTGGEVVSCATPDQLAGVAYGVLKKVISRPLTATT